MIVVGWGLALALATCQEQDATKPPVSTQRAPAQAAPMRKGSGALAPITPQSGPYGEYGGYGGLYPRARAARPAQRFGTPGSGATFVAPASGGSPFTLHLPGQSPAAPGTAPAAPGVIATPGSRLPPLILKALESGPLTEAQAAALVDLLMAGVLTKEPEVDPMRLLDQAPDPDLIEVAARLDGLAPEASGPLPKLDAAHLRDWFVAIDTSRDAALSFLEWRDRTAGPVENFRALDRDRNGALSFEEFARAMLLNAAREGRREVDAELFDWAAGTLPANQRSKVGGADPLAEMADADVVALARAELAAAAAQQAALAAAKHPPAPTGGVRKK